jgi:hypothetical protein
MTFRVGQKVVCVRDDCAREDGVIELVKGQIYTIRWCGLDGDGRTSWSCVRLDEIFRDASVLGYRNNIDCPFAANRFRPIVERKTDISIFTRMLTPEGVDA